jgi:hypothetical protein
VGSPSLTQPRTEPGLMMPAMLLFRGKQCLPSWAHLRLEDGPFFVASSNDARPSRSRQERPNAPCVPRSGRAGLRVLEGARGPYGPGDRPGETRGGRLFLSDHTDAGWERYTVTLL